MQEVYCFFEIQLSNDRANFEGRWARKGIGFFGWYEQSLSLRYVIEAQLYNEVAAQTLALLLQHGLLTEANKQFVLTQGHAESFNDAVSKVFSHYLDSDPSKFADFFLALSLPFAPVEMQNSESKGLLADEAEQRELEQNKQLTLRAKIDQQRDGVARSDPSLPALEYYRPASRATQVFLSQYFEEVKRQMGLLMGKGIDANNYFKWIIKNPWDTNLLLDRLVKLKTQFPAHFEDYDREIQSYLGSHSHLDVKEASHLAHTFFKIEEALAAYQLEEADRELIFYSEYTMSSSIIAGQLESVIKLRKKGYLSPANRPSIEKYRGYYLGFFARLDLPSDLEAKTPNLIKKAQLLQLTDEKTRAPSPLPETKTLPQAEAQKEIVFMCAYIDACSEKQKYGKNFWQDLEQLVQAINRLNTTPEGRYAWSEYCEKSKMDPFYFDQFLIQSLATLYQRGQGQYGNKLLSDLKRKSEDQESKTEYLTEAQGVLFAFVLAAVGSREPVDDSAVETEYNRVLNLFDKKILTYRNWRDLEEVLSVLELMEKLDLLRPSVATEVREKNLSCLLDSFAITYRVLQVLETLLERGVIAPKEGQRYFERMYRYVTEGRDVAGLLKVLIALDEGNGTVLNRETLDAVLAYQNRPYANELKPLFEIKTNSGDIFKRIPLSEENKSTGVSEKKRGNIISQIIAKSDHTAILHNHLNGNLVTGLVLQSSIMGRLEEALPPGHKSPAPTPSEAEGAVNILRLEAEMIRQPDKDPRLKSVEKKGSETKFEEEKISSATEIKGRDENEVLHLYAAHPHYDSNPWGQVQHFLSPLQAQPPAAENEEDKKKADEAQMDADPDDPSTKLKGK